MFCGNRSLESMERNSQSRPRDLGRRNLGYLILLYYEIISRVCSLQSQSASFHDGRTAETLRTLTKSPASSVIHTYSWTTTTFEDFQYIIRLAEHSHSPSLVPNSPLFRPINCIHLSHGQRFPRARRRNAFHCLHRRQCPCNHRRAERVGDLSVRPTKMKNSS